MVCHGKVTCLHHTLRSQAGPRLLLEATWLTSRNSESRTTSSGRNNYNCISYDKLWRGKPLAKPSTERVGEGTRRPVSHQGRRRRRRAPRPQPSQSETRSGITLAPHHARALHHRGMPHPWQTFRVFWNAPQSSRLRALPLGSENLPQVIRWGPLSSRGKPCAPCAYQREGSHGARSSPRQPPALGSS